jgi:hypothetical protein
MSLGELAHCGSDRKNNIPLELRLSFRWRSERALFKGVRFFEVRQY